jgi:cell division protein FtsN
MSLRQGRLYSRGTFSADQAKKWLAALPIRQALPAMAVVLIIALVAVAGWRLYPRPSSKPLPETRQEVVEAPVISDPFTIQVAAYLQRDDAQQVVDQLIQAGLDAFWTHAASAHRSWYQVKVSHFASREAAQAYGRELKSKGLIDDFYVANYEHARRNAAKQ